MSSVITRWIERQYESVDYFPINRGVMFACFAPFTLALLAFDSMPHPLGLALLSLTGVAGGAAALWAFWLWFKGGGSNARSERIAKQSRSYGTHNDG